MDGIVPESSINNINQRNQETSDESEDDCFENGNNDDEATIITMYKVEMEPCGPKFYPIPHRDTDALKTLLVRRVVQQDLFAIVFQELWV